MKKVLTVALTVALAVALVLGVALPVLATPDEAASQAECKPRTSILRGVVDGEPGQDSFTIKAGDQTNKIDVNAATRYFKVTVPQKLMALRPSRVTPRQPDGKEEVALGVKP